MTTRDKDLKNVRLWTACGETCGIAVHYMETKLGAKTPPNTSAFSLLFFSDPR